MRKVSEFVADMFRLPKDVIMDLPRISVCGDKEIYIENHKGVVEYTDSQIRIKMNDGVISISGDKLRIITLELQRMVVNGDFGRIEYEKIGRKRKNVQKNL